MVKNERNGYKMKKWNIGWGAIAACNMNCEFCYSKNKRKNISSLTLSNWINFIDENYNSIRSINYGTGESSMCNDWYTLIRYIKKNIL